MASVLRGGGKWLFDQPYLLLSLTSLFWAVNIVLGRFVAGHVPPVALTFIRWGGAFVLILPAAWGPLRRDWPVIRANFGLMTILALTGYSAYNTMAYVGLQYTQAINALLIQSIGPLTIALWALILFGERLSTAQALGITTSLSGVLIIIARGDPQVLLNVSFNRGDIWFFTALIIFGFYSALMKQRPAIHPLSFLAFAMGWGAFWLIPLLAWEMSTGYVVQLDMLSIATLVYVAVFPSLVAYFFFNRGIELVGPNRAAPFFHLIPVFGSVLAIAFLGEKPQLFHALGYALVLGGIVVATRR
jgi:drug/metabolite transporter (DMT)-like permease